MILKGCFLRFVLVPLLKLLFCLRYRIKVRGLEKIERGGGWLILPNHPALIDPLIVGSIIWSRLAPRPLVLEKYALMPGLSWLMRMIGALPVAAIEAQSGPFRRARVERSVSEAAETLKSGGNILLYPAGHLTSSGRERLGGNSAVRTLLAAAPQARVLLVRTEGLYGSIFSRAFSPRQSPELRDLLPVLLWTLIRNVLIFAPRREVRVELCAAPEDFPRNAEAPLINAWLEKWYNQHQDFAPLLVSYSFIHDDVPAVPLEVDSATRVASLEPAVREKILKRLSEAAAVPPEKLLPESRLGEDLGLDSLALAELLLWVDEEFGASEVELADLRTVGAVLAAAGSAGQGSKDEQPDFEAPAGWVPERRLAVEIPAGATLPEVFLNSATRCKSGLALADQSSGLISWKKLKLAVILFAGKLSVFPGERIGILLPASAGAAISVMACMLSGKVPVMLNWTAGRRNISHAIEVSGLEKILTSFAFMDRLDTDLRFLEDRLVFLEDIKKSLGLFARIKALLHSIESPAALMKSLGSGSTGAQDTAVILFTSGSEAAPKGVPLTHENILSNLRAAVSAFVFRPEDILLGFLPPFHSFGLAVNTILPLVAGLKTALHPDPTDSRALAGKCRAYQASIMAGAPAFLKSILSVREGKDGENLLASLRTMVSGAEKAPEDLFRMVKESAPALKLIEGYGITECSPIVSLNRPDEAGLGVGRALDNVRLRIVHPESGQECAPGERGLILISGPNVFPGYLSAAGDPFIAQDGLRWYNSGDLGFLQDGRLVISGRLKRFVKIAGEMISLPAIEEVLQQRWPSKDEALPAHALLAAQDKDSDKVTLHLFTTVELDLEEVNQEIRKAGLPALARVSRITRLKEMPLLGSGKTDLQALRERGLSC